MTNEQELKLAALKEANTACSTARYQNMAMGGAVMHPSDILATAKGMYAWLTEHPAEHPAPATVPKIKAPRRSPRK